VFLVREILSAGKAPNSAVHSGISHAHERGMHRSLGSLATCYSSCSRCSKHRLSCERSKHSAVYLQYRDKW